MTRGFRAELLEGRTRAFRDPALSFAAAGLLVCGAMVFMIVAAPTFTNDFWFHLAMGEVYFTDGLWPDGDRRGICLEVRFVAMCCPSCRLSDPAAKQP